MNYYYFFNVDVWILNVFNTVFNNRVRHQCK